MPETVAPDSREAWRRCFSCKWFVQREIERCRHNANLIHGMFEAPCQTHGPRCEHYEAGDLQQLVKASIRP